MITAHPQSTTDQHPPIKARSALLRANGTFLLLIGGIQMIFELASHFAGVGPWGRIFFGSSYTIGFLEAHGLAFLIGVLLFSVAASDPKPYWHGFAACVHFLLGGANLLFWGSFATWGFVPMGVAATLCHGFFLVAQLYFLLNFGANTIIKRTIQ